MAPSKLAILSIFLALIFSQIRADIPRCPNLAGWLSEDALEELSIIPDREPSAGPKSQPYSTLTTKDGRTGKEGREEQSSDNFESNRGEKNKAQKNEHSNKGIQKESDSISSLRSKIEPVQKNGSLVEQQVGKPQARADELEKKVKELEQKLQSQRKEKEDLETRANEAEEKINDLLSEIENAGKANDEQETKIRKTEHALEVKVAEVEMWKAKFEATIKERELNEVNELKKESQRNEKGDLKDRVNEAEKKINDLFSKIENVQGTVKVMLKWHELTRPLATKELKWFASQLKCWRPRLCWPCSL